jgi:hypothetical protein
MPLSHFGRLSASLCGEKVKVSRDLLLSSETLNYYAFWSNFIIFPGQQWV